MTDLRETIAELRRLEREATPGTWSAGSFDGLFSGFDALLTKGWAPNPDDEQPEFKRREDALIIAAMRNALPALLDAAERGLNAAEALVEAARREALRADLDAARARIAELEWTLPDIGGMQDGSLVRDLRRRVTELERERDGLSRELSLFQDDPRRNRP